MGEPELPETRSEALCLTTATYDALYDAAEKHGRWLEIVVAKSSIVMLRVSDKDGLRAQERVAGITGLDVAAAKLLPLER